MISEKLAEYYTKAEDKYFDLLDFLDSKGLPVYAYSDFFENKGIPSFVVTMAIIILILMLIAVGLTYKGPEVGEITFSLKDIDGASIRDVKLKISAENGDLLFEGTRSDGGKAQLRRALYSGEKITIEAAKNGYQANPIEFTVGKGGEPSITFSPAYQGIEAKIRIVDKEWKTVVNGATVLVSKDTTSYQFDEDTNGFYKKGGVPSGVTMLLKVSAEEYNDYMENITFNSGETRTIELTPKNAGITGKTTVALTVKNENDLLIDDAKVTISDTTTSLVALSEYTRQGMIVGEVPRNKPLQIVVEKEGYLTYDSEKEQTTITIREKEKQIEIKLRQGGEKLHVGVIDAQLGFAIDEATIQIVRENMEIIDEAITTISGADFTGLDPMESVYVTAYKEGFLPEKQKIKVSSTEEVTLVLQKAGSVNSARLDIYTNDEYANGINGVRVRLFESVDGNKIPYGITGLSTSIDGYVSATVATGKTYEVMGETEVMKGTATVEVMQGELDKKVFLNMQKKENIVEMKFLDLFGNDIQGMATVSALDGKILYDGNIAVSRIFFDGDQRETVEVQIELNDGNLFTENVTIKNKNYVEVTVYNKSSSSLSPQIEFTGIENEQGETTKGITPGAFYWAKFTVSYPRAATRGGIHFRAGQDNSAFVESEKFGLYDISFQGAETSYSYSYTPAPEPGNETVDRANVGAQGEKNKWIEGAINNPKGTYTVKVKVRAEDFSEGKAQIHYRAWTVVENEYYRTPEDLTLETKLFTETKQGLYADTQLQELTIFETLPECDGTLCMTTNFVDEQEQLIEEQGFEAMKEKIYGLEVELLSQEQDYVQIVLTTDSNNIEFTSTQTGNFNFVRETDANVAGEKTASAGITLTPNGKEKTRFYFKGTAQGAAQITVTATGKTEITKTISFNVVQEKTLLVELSETQVMAGKNFTVKVTDSGLKGIENALVKIIDKEGKTVKSILGEGTEGKGKNGYYRIQNDLGVGLYTVEVSLTGYATTATQLLITTQNVLSFPEELEARMPAGQKSTVLLPELINNSEFTVMDITIQTDSEQGTEKETTSKFKVTTMVLGALSPNQKQQLQLTITYTGEQNDTAEETAQLTITGMVEGKFLTKTSSTITMSYNKKLDPSCLNVEPASILINILGSEGTTETETIEVTNNCEEAVFLKKRIKELTKKSFILLTADEIDLQVGETKNINVTANNLVDRGASREQTFNYEIIYDSNAITKKINVSVKTINPMFALSYPPQITLWMAKSNVSEPAIAAQPIFLTNISNFPVENIMLTVDREYGSASNVQVSVEPSTAFDLQKGQAMSKLAFAKATANISEPVRAKIIITGRLGQLNNRAGANDSYDYYTQYYEGEQSLQSYYPKTTNTQYYTNTDQTLGMIDVIIFYSGFNCLKVNPIDSMEYNMTNLGQISRRVEVRNTCAEPVRITGASPAMGAKQALPMTRTGFLSQAMMMTVPQISISPAQTVNVPLTVMTPSPNLKRPNYPIVINGVSEISGTPISSDILKISVYSGREAAYEHQKADTIEVSICGSETKEKVMVPKTASSSNCGEAYCDAVNASIYVAGKIREVISKAQAQGYTKQNQAQQFGCETQGYCTFSQIGMQSETFELYLQNDALSAEVLQAELNKVDLASNTPFREDTGSRGFMVESGVVDSLTIGQRALAGYDRTIFLSNNIRGCGYYKIQLEGAFKAGPEGIEAMTPIVSVRVMGDYQTGKLVTKECETQITNASNFNPIDKGTELGKDYGTWFTTIDAETQLNDIAKKLAKERYGSETRISLGSGNKLRLVQGALEKGMAEMCISGGDKKTLTLKIDTTTINATNQKDKEAFNESIKRMAIEALTSSFGKEGSCIVKQGDSYTCIRLIDPERGNRKIAMDKQTISLGQDLKENCSSATIYSNVKEALDFRITPGNKFTGVKKITITSDDTTSNPIVQLTKEEQTNNTTTNTTGTILGNGTGTGTDTGNGTGTGTAANTGNGTGAGTNPVTGTNPTSNPAEKPTTAKASAEQKIIAGQKEKISFAEETSTAGNATAEPIAENAARAEKAIYYSYEIIGGQIQPIEKSNPIELKQSAGRTSYPFYRNIKICITTQNLDEVGVENNPREGTAAYVAANGSEFNLEIFPEGRKGLPADSKLIKINTGTLHPYELLEGILAETIPKGQPNYFVITWAGKPDQLNLQMYREALTRQGYFDDKIVAGTEASQAQMTAEQKAISDAVKRYAITCLATSVVCNGITAGLPSGVGSAALDCGIPLMTVLKKQTMQTPGLDLIGKGIDAAWGAVAKVLESAGNALGFTNFKPTKIKLFNDTEKLETTSWTPEKVQQEKTASAIGTGAAAGALGELLRPTIWQRYGSTISTPMQKAWADEVAKAYGEEFEKTLDKSIAKPGGTSAVDIKGLRKAYEKKLSSELKAEFEKAYKASVKRKSGLTPSKIGSRLLSPLESKQGIGTMEKVITDAIQSDKVKSKNFDEFMLSKVNDTPGAPTYMEKYFGTDATAVKAKLKAGSELDLALKKAISAPNVEELVAKQFAGSFSKDGLLKSELKLSDLSPKISALVEEAVPGIDATTKASMIDEIEKGLLGKAPGGAALTPVERATVIFNAPEYAKDAAGNVIYTQKGIPMLNPAKQGDSLQDIGFRLRSVAKKPISEQALKSGKVEAIAKAMSDDVTKAVGEGVAKNMDDISKVSVWKRIASKVNLRVGTALGWGIGCGMLSNAAGMLAFDGTMKSKAAKEKEETFTLPNYTFTKNQLYKVTIAEGFKTPYFEIVENSAETSKPVKGKMPTMLVSGEKEIKGQKLTPEERILEVYPILTSRYEIRNVLLEHYEDYSKQRGIEKDTKRMFESSILKTYMAPKIQKLVFKYTGIKTLDCKDNTDRVEYLGEKPEGAEPLALAIATTYLTRMNYSTKIQEELDGKGTWLADKLRTAVEWRRSNSEEKMTIDTARKVFPEQGTKQEDLQKFVEDVAFWEQAYKNSTKNSVDFCQGTQ